jgi:hypothetical protein
VTNSLPTILGLKFGAKNKGKKDDSMRDDDWYCNDFEEDYNDDDVDDLCD